MIQYEDIYEKVFNIPHYSVNKDRKFTCQLVHNYLTGNEKNVIDIGSGRVPVLLELIEKFPSSQIVSCDLKKFHDIEVPFRKLNLTIEKDRDELLKEFPLFDFLTCMDVLEHIEENNVVIKVNDHCNPVLIHGEDNEYYINIVMPMKLSENYVIQNED